MHENKELVEKLLHCAVMCKQCANACLDEDDIKSLVKCIRLDNDCAEICKISTGFLIRHSDCSKDLVKICERVCRDCAVECEKHDMEHCNACAKTCRDCEAACKSY